MGGYSKIKETTNTNNNDPKSPPKSPRTDPSPDPIKGAEPATQEDPTKNEEQQQEDETQKKKPSIEAEEEGDLKGKLKRNFSTASNRFLKLDRQNSSSMVSGKALQGALRRAFSVRSSASDKYSRIYSDRTVALASPYEEDGGDEEEDVKVRSGKEDVKEKKKHKSSKIIRACKRILGL